MITPAVARASARYASIIAAPLLGTACGSPHQRASDATIVRAAAQAQASVTAYERSATEQRDGRPDGPACGSRLRTVAVEADSPTTRRALFDASSGPEPCAAYR